MWALFIAFKEWLYLKHTFHVLIVVSIITETVPDNYASTIFLNNFASSPSKTYIAFEIVCYRRQFINIFVLRVFLIMGDEKFIFDKTVQRFIKWYVLIIILKNHVRRLHNLYLQISLTSYPVLTTKEFIHIKSLVDQ